ncbi:response regulator transcription factor [Saccharopolyspora sp. CA-218241]|uniref:response regulator transcription factor n=1 Tax=Saccharopolyspora sp. CA-218241 TaxID=3240027 RepID=UPI003D985A03
MLVVQDEPTVAEVISDYLRAAGYLVVVAADGGTGLELVSRLAPDLVVLDTSLPGLVLDRFHADLRADSGPLLLTLTGPAPDDAPRRFSPRELVARVRRVLLDDGVAVEPGNPVLVVGDLVANRDTRLVSKSGRELVLTDREFELLCFLMQHPGRTWRKDELARGAWEGEDTAAVLRTVRRLRELVEDDPSRPRRLVTVWGVGYRFEPDDR